MPFALSGIFTRWISADLLTVLGWRGLFGSALTLAYIGWRGRGTAPMAFGWRGWVLASVGSLASLSFLGAFRMTFVANVALIYAITPFATAALGWLILREAVSRGVLVAAGLSLAGVAVIVSGGLGAPQGAGDAVALAMVALSALYVVLIRLFGGVDAVLAGVVSSLQLFAVALVLGAPFAISAHDLAWTAAFGLSYATGFILWTEGAQRVPAAEVGVLATAETPLASLFGWLMLAEVPPRTSLVGGGIVLAAVLWRGGADLMAARSRGGSGGSG